MPLIQVKLIEEVFTPAQKTEIISKVTDAMIAVAGENLRPFTVVTVEEVGSGDWGIGGKALTSSDVQAVAQGTAAARN